MDTQMLEIESAEAEAWLDQWAAAPVEFRQQFQMQSQSMGLAVLLKMQDPIAHFNMALLLGSDSPLSLEGLDQVLNFYSGKSAKGFMILGHPHMQPEGYQAILQARGLQVMGHWDRIFRGNQAYAPREFVRDVVVETVTEESAAEWSKFVIEQYKFLPFLPWLRTYAGRDRWRHYIVRKNGQIVAARSFFNASNGWVWSGIEAPVPGFMTMEFAPDFAIWDSAIQDLLPLGVRGFVADIERIDDKRALPSYREFLGHFGFQLPYRRDQWGIVS